LNELSGMLQIGRDVISSVMEQGQLNLPTVVIPKGDRDMVTDTDVMVEHHVRAVLARRTPSIAFYGEEGGGTLADDRFWVLDPIDGTANFLRGMPLFGISLALVQGRRPVLGVIGLPMRQQTYWAADGLGAWRNGSPITTGTRGILAEAMVAVGDYGTGADAEPRNRLALTLHQRLAAVAQRVRMLGSAAIDLVSVADGTIDASITLGNNCWDMAAGAVIAREAGAAVIDGDGSTHNLDSVMTIATSQPLSPAVLSLLASAISETGWRRPLAAARAQARHKGSSC
jgi:myo-inositol-1(or 4)-monophosphatase